ncbi:MAG: glycoside hydrolase family 3 N-terminal domain-containing protein [Sphingomicrobium sp.]
MLAAYNRVNGDYCAEHGHILTNIVWHDWGFDGVVVSDWFGTISAKSLDADRAAQHVASTAGR